ncbi:helix-turn-helix transcriptional regulator [bacterium]|nr:helix-turn-helix transcriptional regulator [bacterium]
MHNRLKLLRKKLSLTQQEFSEMLGISQNFLSMIEQGKSKISAELCLSLSKINVNLDWLITGQGEMFKTLPSEDRLVNIPDPTGDLAAAVRLLAEMPENKRRDCLNYIQDKKLLLDLQREIEKIKAD